MEREGIIEGYIAIVDFTKLGFQIVRLYLKLQNTTEEIEGKMINFFVENPQTLTVYKIDGYYNLAVGFLVRHLNEYQNFYQEFLKKYKKYVTEKSFSVFKDYLHYHRNYLVEKKKHDFSVISTGSFKRFNYDQKDIQLLKMVSTQARISLLELAKKLQMTPTGVKYKLKSLEKEKIIVAYKTRINFSRLGYQYYKIDLQLEDINIVPALNQFVIQHPNVIYQGLAIGGSDFEFDCELKTKEDFYKLINEIKNMFPEKIRSYFYYKALKIYKYSYMPEIEF